MIDFQRSIDLPEPIRRRLQELQARLKDISSGAPMHLAIKTDREITLYALALGVDALERECR